MNLPVKLLVSLLIAAGAFVASMFVPQLPLWLLLGLTAILCALLPTAAGQQSPGSTTRTEAPAQKQAAGKAASGPREEGQVKWFNVSKGFGFITKDDGEEVFVHFRSIRGEGRRRLRDGQRVSFVVADSDKGPQAEDVEPL